MSKEASLDEYCIEGKAFINNAIIDCSILIKEGKIAKISKLPINQTRVIKLSHEQILLPAGIDLHVHFRDWNESYKETIITGSQAALAGGITTVLDMPNTKPPVNNLENLMKRFKDFKMKSLVDFGLHIRPSNEIEEALNEKECFAVKFYEEDLPTLTYYSKYLISKKVVFHAQYGNDEVSAVEDILLKSRDLTNIRFAHISRAKSLKLIHNFKLLHPEKRVYIEVTPHHTFLSYEDLKNKHKGYLSVRPPLASKNDNLEIIKWLNDGKIDFIASDHAPHSLEEKFSENPPPGYPSIEIMYSLFFNYYIKGVLSLDKIVKCLCESPGKYLGIKKGRIAEGYYADLAVLNFKKEISIDSSKFFSMSKFSPFDGMNVKGIVEKTIIRGKLVYENGQIIDKLEPKSITELVN